MYIPCQSFTISILYLISIQTDKYVSIGPNLTIDFHVQVHVVVIIVPISSVYMDPL